MMRKSARRRFRSFILIISISTKLAKYGSLVTLRKEEKRPIAEGLALSVRQSSSRSRYDRDFSAGERGAFQSCFAQVLLLAREAGVLRMGALSLDGTRLAGAGSVRAVRRLEEIERELEGLGGALLAQATLADLKDRDGEGTLLPEELAEPKGRRKKLLAAKAAILARREAARAEGRREKAQSAHQSQRASVSEAETRCLQRGHGPPSQFLSPTVPGSFPYTQRARNPRACIAR